MKTTNLKTITVLAKTRKADLKVGDYILSARLMRVTKLGEPGIVIRAVDVLPKCKCKGCEKQCKHEHCHHFGWGQFGVLKVIKTTTGKKRKRLSITQRQITIGLADGADLSKCCKAEIKMSRVFPRPIYCKACGKNIVYEDQVSWYRKPRHPEP